MAPVDVAPTFGAELKVRSIPHRLPPGYDLEAMEIFRGSGKPPMPLLTGWLGLGWLQTSQRLGCQRHRMARRHTIVLSRAECHRKGIQRQAQCFGQEVL